MVRLHGCTFLSFLNGAATALSSLSMVQLHISLLSHWCDCTFLFSLNSISIMLSINLCHATPLHIWSPSIIFPKHSHSLPYAQYFFSSTCWKLPFQKNLFLLCIFLKNHPHSSIIYFLFSCPKSTIPKPVWSLLISVLCTPSHWLHLHGKTTHHPGESQQSYVWC